MFRSRVLAVLLAASFAVQLLLAGVGSTCVRASDALPTAEDASMAGMDMSSDGRVAPDLAAPAGERDHRARGDAPCGQSANPSTCQILSACATGFVSVASSDVSRESEPSLAVPASEIDAPASRSVAPELPPPRA